MHDETADLKGDLIDVSELTLRDLDKIIGSALAQALRPIIDRSAEATEPVAGFSQRP
jgi:FXSXX-COOH protein